KATTGGGTTVADMTIGGQRAYFDQTGVHAGSAGQPVNAAADQALNQALGGFGMKTYVAAPQSQPSGATASYTAGSLAFLWTLAGAALGGRGAKRLSDDLLTRRTATTCPLDS